MKILRIDDKVYNCEAISEVKKVGNYYNCTLTGPDKKCLKILQKMLESSESKRFKANTLYGKYKGMFQVLQIDNSRVCIIRFITLSLKF